MQTAFEQDVSNVEATEKHWNVVLLDSNQHSFAHVTILLMQIFGKNLSDAQALTEEVHRMGRAIAITCSEEEAIVYKEKVAAFGPDIMMDKSDGPLPCTVEPADF